MEIEDMEKVYVNYFLIKFRDEEKVVRIKGRNFQDVGKLNIVEFS